MHSLLPGPPPQQETPRTSLLSHFLKLTDGWLAVFSQKRTFQRALAQAPGGLLCLGRRTLTRILWTNGREQEPWAADYHLHSRSEWEPQALFDPIVQEALPLCRGRLVGMAFDDTRLHKTGRCIQQAFYQRDPLSPAFHVNLMLGRRFLQASLLGPAFGGASRFMARALPVRFCEVSRVKRPGKNAGAAEMAQWRKAKKAHNLSTSAVQTTRQLRESMDRAGGKHQTLVMAGDGSFCNRTCFAAPIERTELLVRCRKDAVLCRRAKGEGRRFDGKEKFTPEAVRKDDTIAGHTIKLHYGGKKHKVRFKEIREVPWQGGARRRPLRVLVIAPTP